MMRKIFPALLFKLVILFGCTAVSAQPGAITTGETLNYEGKLSKAIFRGISVADISFTVAPTANGDDYLIKTEARSKGSLTKLFGFRFLQIFESTVDGETLRILKTTKRDEQGERLRESEAFFDYKDKRVTYIETDPNDRMRPPRKIASAVEGNMQDLISGIYTLRRLPLAVGKTFQMSVSDSGLVYNIPVRVAARELQTTVLGKVWCFRVEPEVFGAKRVIEQKGAMTIWIVDDAHRVPVRATINTDGYKIEVKLKKLTRQ